MAEEPRQHRVGLQQIELYTEFWQFMVTTPSGPPFADEEELPLQVTNLLAKQAATVLVRPRDIAELYAMLTGRVPGTLETTHELAGEVGGCRTCNRGPGAQLMFDDDMTLGAARKQLRELVYPVAPTGRAPGEGHECPCCKQRAQVYRRRIHRTLARALVEVWRAGGTELYVHAPSLPGDTHEVSQLAWWGLVEEELTRRPDGGRAGYWRCTEAGEKFIRGEGGVHRHVHVYDAEVLGWDGEVLTISDALGEPFDYRELMGQGELVA